MWAALGIVQENLPSALICTTIIIRFECHLTTTQNETDMKTERNIITMDEYGQIRFPSTTSNYI